MPAVPAEPYNFVFQPKHVALLIIDMQRDFVDPGEFGEALGNDISPLRKEVPPATSARGSAQSQHSCDPHARGPSA